MNIILAGGLQVLRSIDPTVRDRWVAAIAARHHLSADDVLVPAHGRLRREGVGWIAPRRCPVMAGARIDDRRTAPPRKALNHKSILRPYQVKAVEAMERHVDGVLVSPCGSGKTTMGLALIARRHTPALVLVHTRDLLDQWVQRARAELPTATVRTWSGVGPAPQGDVVVGMVQALARHATAISDQRTGDRFGLVLVDEAHHAPARTWAAVVSALPARYVYGLTATPERLDGLTGLIELHLGPTRHEVPREELEAHGAVLVPEVRLLVTNLRRGDLDRIDLIRKLAAKRARAGRSVLVLVDRVQLAQDLTLDLVNVEQVAAAELVSSVPQTERRRRLDAFRLRKIRVLVATQLADEALDLPVTDSVILGSPTSATGRVEQRIGRALRPSPGKPRPEVWDLIDEGTVAHTLARQQLYLELGWPTTTVRTA